MLRLRAAIGAVVRDGVLRSGGDPAAVPALRLADKAAAELAALPDTPRRRAADGKILAAPRDSPAAGAEALAASLDRLVSCARAAAASDPAGASLPPGASLMEWFAWSLARRRPPCARRRAP